MYIKHVNYLSEKMGNKFTLALVHSRPSLLGPINHPSFHLHFGPQSMANLTCLTMFPFHLRDLDPTTVTTTITTRTQFAIDNLQPADVKCPSSVRPISRAWR